MTFFGPWKVTERVYAGGKDTEGVDDGPDIVPIWKRKVDVHDPGMCRGITLSQVLELLERVLDARIRIRVECDFGEEQKWFRRGRGTTGRGEEPTIRPEQARGKAGSGWSADHPEF